MRFSQALLTIRKSKKFSQEKMAETLNVSRQTISNWENDKSYPDLETIVLISDIFKISLDELLKEDKKIVENLNKKIKLNKILKIIIISLVIIIVSIGAYFSISKHIKSSKVLERLDKLGFDNPKYGYIMLEEDGVGYFVYKSEKGKITFDEIYAETRDISSGGITINYVKDEVIVRYFDEKVTVYCDEEGNLKNNMNNEEKSLVYKKYKDRTVKMIRRMIELFDEIYE